MSKKKAPRRQTERQRRISLSLAFSIAIFIVLLFAVVLAALAAYLLVRLGIIGDLGEGLTVWQLLLIMAGISLVLGSVLLFFTSKIPLHPINDIISGLNRLAAGDFKTRLSFRGIIARHPAFEEITESFNKMAVELENTELLRSDFVNNFSHEFKTPIVSIAGFARLLNKGGLSEAERAQYLQAIEEESMRLSDLATNLFRLTKVENQTILTNLTRFDLSEQLRAAILLFEEKWTEKQLDLQLELGEFFIVANEELLMQVWINLMDNAVKFADACGALSVNIAREKDALCVRIGNTGAEIPPDKQDKIFRKFYQADESHAGLGNGVGLAIVKRIIELHRGEISLNSENGMTVFSVRLPQKEESN